MSEDHNVKVWAVVHPERGIDVAKIRSSERQVHPLITEKMKDDGWHVAPVLVARWTA